VKVYLTILFSDFERLHTFEIVDVMYCSFWGRTSTTFAMKILQNFLRDFFCKMAFFSGEKKTNFSNEMS